MTVPLRDALRRRDGVNASNPFSGNPVQCRDGVGEIDAVWRPRRDALNRAPAA